MPRPPGAEDEETEEYNDDEDESMRDPEGMERFAMDYVYNPF